MSPTSRITARRWRCFSATSLSDQEKQDIKALLKALRGPSPEARMQDWVRPVVAASSQGGKALFEGKATCVNCHQADGKGVPGVFPPLADNPSRRRQRRQLRRPHDHYMGAAARLPLGTKSSTPSCPPSAPDRA